MSNYLAVANVTAALQQLLSNSISRLMPGVPVTTLPPDRMIDAQNTAGCNVFLFQATPNPALRNADQPNRSATGTLERRVQSALDLHYLLTFVGKGELYEPERLLAITTMALDSESILLPHLLRDAAFSVPSTILAASNLASQKERVRLTHTPLSLEELHRFWTLFGSTPYRLSTVYRASVVLLAADQLPVTRRKVSTVALETSTSTDPPEEIRYVDLHHR